MSCHCYPCVVSLKTRIVRILFSCMLPQTDNCPTTVYRHLQCMSLLIDVSGVLRGHYTIGSFYDRKLWFLLWGLSLFLSLNSCFFIVYFRYILECDILWMYLFLPYCVRKWHNKTVQSINLFSSPHWRLQFQNSFCNLSFLDGVASINRHFAFVIIWMFPFLIYSYGTRLPSSPRNSTLHLVSPHFYTI